MMLSPTVSRRIRVGGIAAAAAAALVIAAPQASADTFDMQVSGSQHVAGCTYRISIPKAPNGSSATFWDNGKLLGDDSGSAILNSGINVSWTPTTAGAHKLTASLGYLSVSEWVNDLTVQVSAASGGCGLNSLFPSISG